MATTIIIARHGNTFGPGETPTRVGARTDLPLVETERGRAIGRYLRERDLIPSVVYAAPLKRTMQTAQLAIEAMGLKCVPVALSQFTEIDYGPDENCTEEQVLLRLGDGDAAKGEAVIGAWNRDAVVPPGWSVDSKAIIESWLEFAQMVADDRVALIVSSNGIIRFAPHLTGDFEAFAADHNIKVSTGGLCIFRKEDGHKLWRCLEWNVEPYKIV